jgi:hypothetical protein
MESLKVKNQGLSSSKPAKVVPQVDNSDLKLKTKDEDLTIGINSGKKEATKTKPKEKKQPDNKEIAVEFKHEDLSEGRFDNRDRRGYGNKKNQGKFQFSNDDFPEL